MTVFHMTQLVKKIVLNLVKRIPENDAEFGDSLRRALKSSHSLMPTKPELLKAYHELIAAGKLKRSVPLENILRKRSVRTLSGVTIITVLTKPHPCPGKCIYCPNEHKMPKSYIADEPAAARALALDFDPYRQVVERIRVLENNGHPTDKIELIVKGGSWNAYPLGYQYWFILRCFEAANKRRQKIKSGKQGLVLTALSRKLFLAQKKNENAKHRIIGLTFETRPDLVSEKSIAQMRDMGATRVEIGAQTIDDKILKLVKRGHDSAETARATKLLKNSGFKVDYHLMPQLPGSTPKKDAKMLADIFLDARYRPDMIKIYPCTVVKNSPLYKWVQSKKFRPYGNKRLIEILINFKSSLPRYVRISRLIRDIPGHHIVAGNRMTNLRQVIQAEMARRGLNCNCLRCREIGHQKLVKTIKPKIKLFQYKYAASDGTEYFLSMEDAKRNVVFAFCRLRINRNGLYPAFIRELHTYGRALEIGAKNRRASQHKGLGVKLILAAEAICKKHKISELAVISGVGVRFYYRKLGYRLEHNYMVKSFK